MSKLDTLLRSTLFLSVSAGAAGIGYYYGVHLPDRDRRIETENRNQMERLAYERALEKERTAKAAQEKDAKEAENKLAISLRYNNCLQTALKIYRADWAIACKRIAGEKQKNYSFCMTTGTKGACERLVGEIDSSETCALPVQAADRLNGQNEKANTQCLQESQMGFQ